MMRVVTIWHDGEAWSFIVDGDPRSMEALWGVVWRLVNDDSQFNAEDALRVVGMHQAMAASGVGL